MQRPCKGPPSYLRGSGPWMQDGMACAPCPGQQSERLPAQQQRSPSRKGSTISRLPGHGSWANGLVSGCGPRIQRILLGMVLGRTGGRSAVARQSCRTLRNQTRPSNHSVAGPPGQSRNSKLTKGEWGTSINEGSCISSALGRICAITARGFGSGLPAAGGTLAPADPEAPSGTLPEGAGRAVGGGAALGPSGRPLPGDG